MGQDLKNYHEIKRWLIWWLFWEKSDKFDAKTLDVITKSKAILINKMKSQIKVWVKIYIESILLTPAPELRSD